jgi:glycine/D-amino acid oxidase-like deaminating enzyme
MTVAVVGGGTYGWNAALRLAEAGAAVTLFDPRPPGAADQTSGGRSRLLRFEYGGDPLYPELTLRAVDAWNALERRSGATLYEPLGALMLVPAGYDGAWERRSIEAAAAIGRGGEMLDAGDVARRWPDVATRDLEGALYNRHGGLLHAAEAVRTVAALTLAAGAHHRTETVDEVEAGSVATATGIDGFDQVLLTTGAWTPSLRPELAITATRQVSVHLDGGPSAIPVFGEGAPFAYYGTPAYPGAGFKIGIHVTGPAGDPDDPAQRRATAAEVAQLTEHAAHRFPQTAGAAVVSADVCFYEMTANEDPIVARLDDRTVVCAGFSGHGFKFSPVVAAAAADLVLDLAPTIPLDRFDLR